MFLKFFGCVFTGFATYPASINIQVNIGMLINPKNAESKEMGREMVGGVPYVYIYMYAYMHVCM